MNPIPDLDSLRRKVREATLTNERRQALQQELAESTTPAQRFELDAMIRRLPAAETAEIRDLLYR
ncbi:hypothetical protein ABIB25_004780 [Nakamurella sp. UYEF19]|uniref:hypothetical protein n=1 Tax=Nakamurella sp. UYEF19 TaxID=1756392 RepID=UPI0033928450